MTDGLFRVEALDAKRMRLEGVVSVGHHAPIEATTLCIAALVGAAVVGLCLGRYDHTETVTGQVSVLEGVSKIVAPRPGTITSLRVRSGQFVNRGDVVATVQLQQASPNGHAVADDKTNAIASQLRDVDHNLSATKARYSRDVASLGEQASSIKKQLEQAKLERSIAAAQISLATSALERVAVPEAIGVISKTILESRQTAVLQARQSLVTAQQQAASLTERLLAVNQQQRDASNDGVSKLAELESARSDIQQRRLDVTEISYAVIAPISGVVADLQASQGKFEDGQISMMTIVPRGAHLQATLYVPSKSIGFIRPGDSVRLRYDAFPYQKFGTFSGLVYYVSRSILSPADTDSDVKLNEPVYPVAVRITSLLGRGRKTSNVRLSAGMTLTADIVLEQRTLIDWILEPLRNVTRR